MSYDALNQSVITSLSISVKDDDSFFTPVRLAHNGFASDGFFYTAGVQNPAVQASWATELPSDTRGALPSFPTSAVVLVNRASVAILDAADDLIQIWMIFYLCDQYALPVNFTNAIGSYTAQSASWAAGRLSVVLVADPGSPVSATTSHVAVLTLDFANDSVYIDLSLAPV